MKRNTQVTTEPIQAGRLEGGLEHTKRDRMREVMSSRRSFSRELGRAASAILETIADIPEGKRALATFEKQRELAHAARVSMLGELSASIAHEVNQPLTAITIIAEATQHYLAQDPPKVNEARVLVDRIVSSVDSASNVIRSIRALSKKVTPDVVRLDINEVIEETVPLVRSQAIDHGVSMRLDLGPKLPEILADRIHVQQVVINLIINAIDAMKTVTDRARELMVRSQLYEGSYVLVAVEDTGVGIEPHNVNRLFDAFFTTKPDGMGMGLSICRSIIEAHSGRIWASANAKSGAIIQFTLPRADAGATSGFVANEPNAPLSASPSLPAASGACNITSSALSGSA
jgi:two-component system, LuxR family, sensor kinase FixL